MAESMKGSAQNMPMCRSDKGNGRQQSDPDGMGTESP